MALYTRKGDQGDTSAFSCKQRFSKNSLLAEALGSVDEINSLLGLCKAKNKKMANIIEKIQHHLFIIQAELAGADKKIDQQKVKYLEEVIDAIEKQLPPIKSFFISGQSELSALFDYARTIARRAERRVIALLESKKKKALPRSESTAEDSTTGVSPETLAYLNRLSSVLYAMARLINAKSGIKEKRPSYK